MIPLDHMWEEIANYYREKRCLITGADGFIGKAIIDKLREFGACIIKIDITHGSDIRNYSTLSEGMYFHNPEVMFHLAAQTEVGYSYDKPHETYETNVIGTLNILESARKRCDKLRSLVIASTDKVYGLLSPPYKELDALKECTNPYAASKQYADRIAQDYARMFGLPIRILRCCNIYGPGQTNRTTLITNTILSILEERRMQVVGNHQREWLYIDDAVLAYLLVGMITDNELRIYNVGSGEVVRSIDLVRKIIELIGYGDYNVHPVPQNKPDFNQRVDSREFRYTFPLWKPTKLTTGLGKTIAWYKEQVERRVLA